MKRLLLAGAAALLPLYGCSSNIKLLLSDKPLVRAEALNAATRAPEEEKRRIVEAMRARMGNRRPEIRAYAAAALEDLGPAAAAATPELIAAMHDEDIAVSAAAERTLMKLPSAAPALAGALDRARPDTAAKLGRVLSALGEPGALALAMNFNKGSRELAVKSAAALALMGPAARPAVPALARAASSGDPQVRAAAALALTDIGAPAGNWLADALRSQTTRSRAGAAAVLAAMPRPSPEALEPLAAALNAEDRDVRENCAAALAAYSQETMAALPEELVKELSKAAAAGGRSGAQALLALVRTGRAGGKWLDAALKSADPAAREAAALSLILMFPPPREPVGALFAALLDPETGVRRAAAAAIGNYAISRPEALPRDYAARLAGQFDNRDPETRRLVAFPLGRMAVTDKKALSALISALSHKNTEVQTAAASALAPSGEKAAAALPALWKVFRTDLCAQRLAAARALAAIRPSLRSNRSVAGALEKGCPEAVVPASPGPLPGLAPRP